jgi:23S rRNA (cytidine1920-2'-O)/16S rRNA (cytidine1409-2'-O)-methyltransferase
VLKKIKAFEILTSRGLVGSEEKARAIIMEGRLLADGTPVSKPGDMLSKESTIRIIPGRRYVSRGGYKIEGAFTDLGIKAKGKNAIDIGSSTGGFTDYLVKNGAKSVTAIDVGYGLLAWDLRNCEKVRLLEKTNIRHLDPSVLESRADLVVTDVSFISIKKIFKKIMDISSTGAEILLLVKPQFELSREHVRHKGVVLERGFHTKALKEIVDFLKDFDISIEDITFSRIKGASGNIEFWIYLRKSIISAQSELNYDKIIDDAVNGAHLYFARD